MALLRADLTAHLLNGTFVMPIFPSWSAVTPRPNPASWLAASSMASWTDPAWSAMDMAVIPPRRVARQGDLAACTSKMCRGLRQRVTTLPCATSSKRLAGDDATARDRASRVCSAMIVAPDARRPPSASRPAPMPPAAPRRAHR